MEELLNIVAREYQKISGTKADPKVYLNAIHSETLQKRLTENYGFKIMKGRHMGSVEAIAKAVAEAYDFLDDVVEQIVIAAEEISGKKYTAKQPLFAEFSERYMHIYRYQLCQMMFDKYKIWYNGKIVELKTAEDIAACMFENLPL